MGKEEMQVVYCIKKRAYDFSLNIMREVAKERHRSQLKGFRWKGHQAEQRFLEQKRLCPAEWEEKQEQPGYS